MTGKFLIFIMVCLALFWHIQGQTTTTTKSSKAKSSSSGGQSTKSSGKTSSSTSKTSSSASQTSSKGTTTATSSSSGSKASSGSKKNAIGFARALVIPDKTPEQVPVGKFVVPTTNAPGLPFPDLSKKNLNDPSIIPGMTANINNQIVSNIIKNIPMGPKHPTIWDSTHCSQVPFFPRTSPQAGCVTQSGWYMDMSTSQCEQVTVTCDQMATLNFFMSESLCKKWCTDKKTGAPLKVIPTNYNLDPRKSCIQKPILNMGVNTQMKIVWSYDAATMTCWKFDIPTDTVTSDNIYAGSNGAAACQHMCHDVAPAGSGIGHSLLSASEDHEEHMEMMMMTMMPPT